eukprot:scaffold234224_cov34-Tisochrysis_lutea.AAC.4
MPVIGLPRSPGEPVPGSPDEPCAALAAGAPSRLMHFRIRISNIIFALVRGALALEQIVDRQMATTRAAASLLLLPKHKFTARLMKALDIVVSSSSNSRVYTTDIWASASDIDSLFAIETNHH